MFFIGQRVIVTRPHYKVGQNSVGTVIGYYSYRAEDDEGYTIEDEWKEDFSEPIVKFDEDTVIHAQDTDWYSRTDDVLPMGTFYMDDYVLEAFYEEGEVAHIRNAIHNRHNEHKKRMLF